MIQKNNSIAEKLTEFEILLKNKIELKLIETEEKQKIFIENQSKIIQQQQSLIYNLTSQLDTLQRISEQDRREKIEAIENIESKIKDCEKQIIRTEIKVNEVNEKISEKPTKKGFFGIKRN